MKFNPNRYDLILLFAVVSGIYYVIDETLSSTNNAPDHLPVPLVTAKGLLVAC